MPLLEQRRDWVFDTYDQYFWDEVIDNEGGINKAQTLLNRGIGGIFIPNHPFEPDGAKYTSFLVQSFLETRINSPVAWHQYLIAWMLNNMSGAGVDLTAVVTPHTERILRFLPEYLKPKRGKGLKKYFRKTKDNVSYGGIAIAPPQAERTQKIGKPGEYHRVIEGLFRRLKDIDFWVMFAGLYIKDKIPEKVKIADWRHYMINVGPTLTKQEMCDQAKQAGMNLDEFAFDQLKRLVPEEWR